MKKKGVLLGPFEQQLLTAICMCGNEAFGMAIHEKVEELGGRRVQVTSAYVVLDRLEEKGYVKSWLASEAPERGNRRSRYFKILPAGQEALAESVRISQRLMESWGTLKWLKGLI